MYSSLLGTHIALLRGKIIVSYSNLLLEPYKLWTRKFVAACDGVVPTTTCGKAVPTAAIEDVRPREMGRYRMKL